MSSNSIQGRGGDFVVTAAPSSKVDEFNGFKLSSNNKVATKTFNVDGKNLTITVDISKFGGDTSKIASALKAPHLSDASLEKIGKTAVDLGLGTEKNLKSIKFNQENGGFKASSKEYNRLFDSSVKLDSKYFAGQIKKLEKQQEAKFSEDTSKELAKLRKFEALYNNTKNEGQKVLNRRASTTSLPNEKENNVRDVPKRPSSMPAGSLDKKEAKKTNDVAIEEPAKEKEALKEEAPVVKITEAKIPESKQEKPFKPPAARRQDKVMTPKDFQAFFKSQSMSITPLDIAIHTTAPAEKEDKQADFEEPALKKNEEVLEESLKTTIKEEVSIPEDIQGTVASAGGEKSGGESINDIPTPPPPPPKAPPLPKAKTNIPAPKEKGGETAPTKSAADDARDDLLKAIRGDNASRLKKTDKNSPKSLTSDSENNSLAAALKERLHRMNGDNDSSINSSDDDWD